MESVILPKIKQNITCIKLCTQDKKKIKKIGKGLVTDHGTFLLSAEHSHLRFK